MAENTKIEWCKHTFNPWTGCTKVSPGCDHCYAEVKSRINKKILGQWQPDAPRRRTGEKYWCTPNVWNHDAKKLGIRDQIFCASMADVFDNQAPEDWRADLWHLIARTPNLDWLLLTKRPQNIAKMLPTDWGDGWSHVWLGVTTENQQEADRRIPILRRIPAAIRFLSAEPLLEPITPTLTGIDWVICGGESGGKARYMKPSWAYDLRDQCRNAGVKFFMKQMSRPKQTPIPPDLMTREYPTCPKNISITSPRH